MDSAEQFLSRKTRDQPISLPQDFSDETMAKDWTLLHNDIEEIGKYRKENRLFIAVQLCAVRLYGRFLNEVNDVSPRILSYLNSQLNLPPSLTVQVPERKATYIEYRKNILVHLKFQKFNESAQKDLKIWLQEQAQRGVLPHDLFHQAEEHLLTNRIVLPGASVLERLAIHACSEFHEHLFESMYQHLSPDLQHAIDQLLTVPKGQRHSSFYTLKAYPPAATITSLRSYLQRYQAVVATGLDTIDAQLAEPVFQEYFFQLTKKYDASQMKRFHTQKRYALMICFLLETRKNLLDHLVEMHDQYIMKIMRETKNTYEDKHRALRKRQKKAVDAVLSTTDLLLNWPAKKPLQTFWQHVDEGKFRTALDDLRVFKTLEERGYGDILLKKYPSLRKYFADFVKLPFAAERGTDPLLQSIRLVRQLDSHELQELPRHPPTTFVPKELRRALKDEAGHITRRAWEMGLALAMKDALRSGDLYLPQSKQHVSFWDFMLSDSRWQEVEETSSTMLQLPHKQDVKDTLTQQFQESVTVAKERFGNDTFAQIQHGSLKLKRDDTLPRPDAVTTLQKAIDASMPLIRIEQLLMDVDQLTHFSQHFKPIQESRARPKQFYKTLIAGLISQATNLGVVAMSASVKGISVDMLWHILHSFVREETLKAASAEIVNHHHQLPLSGVYGTGELSSSDGQRFGIRASSLLASYYPRYYGYYQKAIGIYTHVSDQYSVFSTKVISCHPREALYVLDGLLENNTILNTKRHIETIIQI